MNSGALGDFLHSNFHAERYLTFIGKSVLYLSARTSSLCHEYVLVI